MRAKVTQEEFEQRDCMKTLKIVGEWKGTKKPVEMVCLKCGYGSSNCKVTLKNGQEYGVNHSWKPIPDGINSGKQGCPCCSGIIRWKPEDRIAQIGMVWPQYEFLGWVEETLNKTPIYWKVKLRCKLDGYDWSTATVHHLLNNGVGCPCCAGNSPVTKDQMIERVNARIVKLGRQYVYLGMKATKNAEEYCDEPVKGALTYIHLRCLEHGTEAPVRYHSFVGASIAGLPCCAKHGYDVTRPEGVLYVFLVNHPTLGRLFKIGITHDMKSRARQLTKSFADRGITINLMHTYKTTGAEAARLESHYHKVLESESVKDALEGLHDRKTRTKSDGSQESEQIDGFTECFYGSEKTLEVVKEILKLG